LAIENSAPPILLIVLLSLTMGFFNSLQYTGHELDGLCRHRTARLERPDRPFMAVVLVAAAGGESVSRGRLRGTE
jgi:hypothetical protein